MYPSTGTIIVITLTWIPTIVTSALAVVVVIMDSELTITVWVQGILGVCIYIQGLYGYSIINSKGVYITRRESTSKCRVEEVVQHQE